MFDRHTMFILSYVESLPWSKKYVPIFLLQPWTHKLKYAKS